MPGLTITLRIQNPQGFRLAADLLLPSGPGPFPAVLCTHDLLDQRGSPYNRELAGLLVGEGIAVLLLDLTGQGESDGTLEDGTPEQQPEDVGAALDELDRRSDIDMRRVGAFGADGGALAVALRAERDPRIRALVLQSPRSEVVFDAIRRTALPTLLMVGTEDRRALEDAIALNEALVGDKSTRVVPGIESHQGDLAYLRQAVILAAEWLKTHL
ncbi:MAG: alpha/beta hydrolase family protein [Chloroflexota bacterium]